MAEFDIVDLTDDDTADTTPPPPLWRILGGVMGLAMTGVCVLVTVTTVITANSLGYDRHRYAEATFRLVSAIWFAAGTYVAARITLACLGEPFRKERR